MRVIAFLALAFLAGVLWDHGLGVAFLAFLGLAAILVLGPTLWRWLISQNDLINRYHGPPR